MCGIFGGVGKGVRPEIIRALAHLNESRGRDSLGFFASDGSVWKKAGYPSTLLKSKECVEYTNRLCATRPWFVIGHTRASTHGASNDKNAHPHETGVYRGVHNGIVGAPNEFEVDSMYLFHRLHECGGNYIDAWKLMQGSFAVAWTDGKGAFLHATRQTLHILEHQGAIYFSSESNPLELILGGTAIKFSDGETWEVNKQGIAHRLPFLREVTDEGLDLNLYEDREEPPVGWESQDGWAYLGDMTWEGKGKGEGGTTVRYRQARKWKPKDFKAEKPVKISVGAWTSGRGRSQTAGAGYGNSYSGSATSTGTSYSSGAITSKGSVNHETPLTRLARRRQTAMRAGPLHNHEINRLAFLFGKVREGKAGLACLSDREFEDLVDLEERWWCHLEENLKVAAAWGVYKTGKEGDDSEANKTDDKTVAAVAATA